MKITQLRKAIESAINFVSISNSIIIMSSIYIEIIWKAKWKLIAMIGVLAISACSSMDDKRRREAGTTIPWNQPEPWEENPSLTSPIRW